MSDKINALQNEEKFFLESRENYRIYDVDTYEKMYDHYHEHEFAEIFILLSGTVTYMVEQGKYDLKNYDIIIVPPNKIHKIQVNNPNGEYKRMVLWITRKYLDKLSSSYTSFTKILDQYIIDGNYVIRDPEFTFFIKKYLQQIIALNKENFYGSDLLIENAIREFFVYLLRFIIDKSQNKISLSTNEIVTAVITYIENNLNKDLSLNNIANALCYEPTYVAHTFSSVTGTTIHKYIIMKRLNESKKLLDKGYQIKDIVHEIGFNDDSHYIQVFKKEFGITPRQYKAKNK